MHSWNAYEGLLISNLETKGGFERIENENYILLATSAIFTFKHSHHLHVKLYISPNGEPVLSSRQLKMPCVLEIIKWMSLRPA